MIEHTAKLKTKSLNVSFVKQKVEIIKFNLWNIKVCVVEQP